MLDYVNVLDNQAASKTSDGGARCSRNSGELEARAFILGQHLQAVLDEIERQKRLAGI